MLNLRDGFDNQPYSWIQRQIECSTHTPDSFRFTFICVCQFFDDIKIEDPRVAELCIKAGQPTPYQVLCDCLKRFELHSVVFIVGLCATSIRMYGCVEQFAVSRHHLASVLDFLHDIVICICHQ